MRVRHNGGSEEFVRNEIETMADSRPIVVGVVGQRGTLGAALPRVHPCDPGIPRNVRPRRPSERGTPDNHESDRNDP